MADPLYELLIPYFDQQDAQNAARQSNSDTVTSSYLSRLTTLPLAALTTSEQQSLAQTSQSVLRSLQALSKRSHKPIISSAEHLSNLRTTLPKLGQHAGEISKEIPALDTAAQRFANKYSKTSENALLERRRKAMLLSRNIDRVTDILDLPTLLSTAISASTTPSQATATATSASTTANYASALDLHAHIKRLYTLYPNSTLISSLSAQAEVEMKTMTTNLIAGLQAQGIKLAGAMRTIGWLRRVAPELDSSYGSSQKTTINIGNGSEGALGALFLVCRLASLVAMLEALAPLRELADQESARRAEFGKKEDRGGWAGGQHTERYLKRYIEIFREQSFAVISMYKSIFPSALPFKEAGSDLESDNASQPQSSGEKEEQGDDDNPLTPLPSPLATFPIHLSDLLFSTLKQYLPNITDTSARQSLLTQVLYCAGSLGRLGADFSLLIAGLEGGWYDDDDEKDILDEDVEGDVGWEWVEVMKKQRVQASRLELLASGVGTGRERERVGSVAG